MELAGSLKNHRERSGLSQAQVAEKLHLTRQAISRWENGKGYPDLDNLVLLSELYQVTLDELMDENKTIKKHLQNNEVAIKEHKKKIYRLKKQIQNKKEIDEGLFLLLLAAISSFIFPIGIVLGGFVIWRNKKSNPFYKLVYVVSVVALLVNIRDGHSYVSDILGWGEVTVEKIE